MVHFGGNDFYWSIFCSLLEASVGSHLTGTPEGLVLVIRFFVDEGMPLFNLQELIDGPNQHCLLVKRIEWVEHEETERPLDLDIGDGGDIEKFHRGKREEEIAELLYANQASNTSKQTRTRVKHIKTYNYCF